MTDPKLQRLAAAFSPDARPICPRCWSRLDLDWGKGRALGEKGKRGWAVGRPERLVLGGEELTVTTAVHRCANRGCLTAVEVTALLAGGWVPSLVAERRLCGTDAERYARGRHDRAGVWRARDGEPLTAPPQRDLFG